MHASESALIKRIRHGFTLEAGPVWRLLNEQGPYTLRAPDLVTGAIAASLINGGRCAIASPDGTQQSPFACDFPEFLEKQEIDCLTDYVDMERYRLAAVLDSVHVGTVKERDRLEQSAAYVDDGRLLDWLEELERLKGLRPLLREASAAKPYTLKRKAEFAANALWATRTQRVA